MRALPVLAERAGALKEHHKKITESWRRVQTAVNAEARADKRKERTRLKKHVAEKQRSGGEK